MTNTTYRFDDLRKFCDISAYPALILECNDSLYIKYANQKFMGYFCREEEANSLEELCNNKDSLESIKKACKEGQEQVKNLMILPKETNPDEQRWVNIALSYVDIENISYVLMQLVEISDYKLSEHKMQNAVDVSKRMEEVKSNFLATMSHELRTPMQSVYGLLELISNEALSEDVAKMAKTAKNSASGMLEILDDILDLAKVNAGKMELDLFEVPVRTLAYGVFECMEVKLNNNKVKLIPQIEKNVPFVIIGDPTKLRQILLNLVGNAMKFTEEGSITLHITTKTQHIAESADNGKNGISLRFEIIDTGIGMSPETADKLFKPFTQADSSTSRKFGGTGLGLSISQKLVELMGGKIGVDSEEGKGSCFWFEIPTEVLGTDTLTELPDLDGIAVLSVEDHPAGAREIKSSLQSMGANVESCPSFAEGMELIQKRLFDVAVIDQGLPDGLGIDIAKATADIQPSMGLIIYTVRDDIGLQHSAKTIGAKYLTKPASRLGLGEAVKSAAKKRNIAATMSNRPKRLLIAEDTESVRYVLTKQLKTLGVEADFVKNGKEALKMLGNREHGILFTDLHMPEIDGYELATKIRAKEAGENKTTMEEKLPIIVLTADVQMAQRQAYLAHGFDECLLKPISLGQLKQLLVRWRIIGDEAVKPHVAEIEEVAHKKNSKSVSKSTYNNNNAPPINKEDLIKQMGSFDADTVEMLKIFVEMSKQNIAATKQAFIEQNIPALAEEAHSLKGAARSAGCNRLGDIATSIQSVSEQGRLINESDIENMLEEFANIEGYIKELEKEFQ